MDWHAFIAHAHNAEHTEGRHGHDSERGIMDAIQVILGTNASDGLLGTDGRDLILGKKGDDKIDGGAGNDLLFGGKGNDVLMGGAGDDFVFGGKGNDQVDGGAGSDMVSGGKGNDVAIYTMSENLGAHDVYDGGKGLDTLQLNLTYGEVQLESVQRDIAAFNAFLAANADLHGKGTEFLFSSFDLTVRGFEEFTFQLVNTAPTAHADTASTDEDTAIVIAASAVLANDTDPDHLDVLAVTHADGLSALGATVSAGADGSLSYDPTTALALQQLAQGATAIDSFSYTIADLAGATSTSTVNVTVTGVNDAPVASNDTNTTDEDTSITGNVLANDTDVDIGDTLIVSAVNGLAANVGAALTLDSGALLTLNADGSYIYDPNGQFESLGVGQSASDSFSYVIADGHGELSDSATVSITIAGVNDAPVAVDDTIGGTSGGGAIKVAVVGGVNSTYVDAALHLGDSTLFAIQADAILTTAFTTKSEWAAKFSGYDVVVVGENGFAPFDYDGTSIFAALRDFLDAGGGIVTTGVFAGRIAGYSDAATRADADYISPAASSLDSLFVGLGTNFSITDPANPIAGGITSYAAQSLHEVAGAIDTTATMLAVDSHNHAAIAYDEVGLGRSVYLGSTYMAVDQPPFDPGATRMGVVDEIFERAVAWAAGDRSGSSAVTNADTPFTIDPALLLANDTDVDTAHADLKVGSLSPTSAFGAALSFDANGDIVYDPTPSTALQQLHAGEIVTDTFDYTVVDGSGGSDIGTVSLAVAGLAHALI